MLVVVKCKTSLSEAIEAVVKLLLIKECRLSGSPPLLEPINLVKWYTCHLMIMSYQLWTYTALTVLKLVWAEQLTRLSWLVVCVKFHFFVYHLIEASSEPIDLE